MKIELLQCARWNFVNTKAKEFTAQYSTPPIPVLELVETHGASVIFADFGQFNETVSGFCDFKEAKIYINNKDKFERQMFTMAHEFGHWILHRDYFLSDPDKYAVLPRLQEAVKTPFEQEANAFAAELLVPTALLVPVKNASISLLAEVFQVSKTMMEHRLKNV